MYHLFKLGTLSHISRRIKILYIYVYIFFSPQSGPAYLSSPMSHRCPNFPCILVPELLLLPFFLDKLFPPHDTHMIMSNSIVKLQLQCHLPSYSQAEVPPLCTSYIHFTMLISIILYMTILNFPLGLKTPLCL